MATTPLPQLTAKAIVLGIVLAVMLAGANAYLGLFAGITVSASIPAAVISMAILRLFRTSNILENNVVQTAASAGESVAAGVIFTIPALVILGYWDVFDHWWVGAIAGLGGLLGVLFTVPLRRSLIIEERLTYPEGTATAEVLRAGHGGGEVRFLAVAGVIGAVAKLCTSGLKLWSGIAETAAVFGKSTVAYLGANLSPALLGVGYIVGLNIAVLVLVGGAISWYVAIPLYSALYLDGDPALVAMMTDPNSSTVDLGDAIWSSKIRYLGVGAMLVGGIWALVSMRRSIFSGIGSSLAQYRRRTEASIEHTEHDTPMQFVFAGILLFVVPIFALYLYIVGSIGVALAMTVVMVATGFFFSSVAGYMAGLVGSSNNPVSGVTIATILFTALLLVWLLGREAEAGPVAAIMVGAVICCAAAIAGDNLQDLKAGYIVGATPWRQQFMQALGVVSAVLPMAFILNLLLKAYGIGAPTAEQPDALSAPQATLMASVAQGVFGGGLPWTMIAIGAGIGAAIIVVDEVLKARGSSWRAPVLAVAVGIYLPLELAVPIAIGGVLAYLVKRLRGDADGAGPGRAGLLFAAGLITGEALLGVLLAIPIVATGNRDFLALPLGLGGGPGGAIGILVFAAIAVLLYRVGARQQSTQSSDAG